MYKLSGLSQRRLKSVRTYLKLQLLPHKNTPHQCCLGGGGRVCALLQESYKSNTLCAVLVSVLPYGCVTEMVIRFTGPFNNLWLHFTNHTRPSVSVRGLRQRTILCPWAHVRTGWQPYRTKLLLLRLSQDGVDLDPRQGCMLLSATWCCPCNG
jgi:hypothetical protein